MPLTHHEALVPGWLPLLNAARGLLDKATSGGIAEERLLSARLIEDMLPFGYLVKAMTVHGLDEEVQAGVFRATFGEPPPSRWLNCAGRWTRRSHPCPV